MVESADIPKPMCDEFKRMISGMNFKACLADCTPKFKLNVRRHLLKFNDNSINDDDTLDDLKNRRMAVAKTLLGKLGLIPTSRLHYSVPGAATPLLVKMSTSTGSIVSIFDSAPVQIGDRVLIGPGVCICTDAHELDPVSRKQSQIGSYAKPIVIGDDCWIGGRVVIVAGVTIGNGSTVAAGAVVVKDVEANCLVGGVPAKIIRRLDNGAMLPERQLALNSPNNISTGILFGDNIILNSGSAVDHIIRPIKIRAGCELGSKLHIKANVCLGDNVKLDHYTQVEENVRILRNTKIKSDVKVGKSIIIGEATSIGEKSKIGAGVIIGAYCIIGANVSIEAGALIQSEVHVGDRTRIGKGSWVLNGAKLGRRVVIKEDAKVRQDAKIGNRAYIDRNADVLRGVQIGIGITVDEGEIVEDIPDVRGAH
ncbi:hypothetical protein ACHAP3_000307 [Botrytis cinerea]